MKLHINVWSGVEKVYAQVKDGTGIDELVRGEGSTVVEAVLDALEGVRETIGIRAAHPRARTRGGDVIQVACPVVEIDGEGRLVLTWTRGEEVISLDAAGPFEWFYRDRYASSVEGTRDEPEPTLPPRFWELLRRVAAPPPTSPGDGGGE